MPKKGYKQTKEHRDKLNLVGFQKGHERLYSDEIKMKMRGRVGYWKGKKRNNPDYIEKISKAHKGQHNSIATQFKKGQISLRKGKKFPQVKGKNHYAWKGGITPKNEKIRKSLEYKLWRKSVFERDNFTCQKYKTMGGELRVHHINNFAEKEELRLAIDNGITLSKKAHDEFHKKYGFKNNTKGQLEEFLGDYIY